MDGMEKLLYSLDDAFGPLVGPFLVEFFKPALNDETIMEQLPYWHEGTTYRAIFTEPQALVWGEDAPPLAQIKELIEEVRLHKFLFYGKYYRVGYAKVTNTLYYKWLR